MLWSEHVTVSILCPLQRREIAWDPCQANFDMNEIKFCVGNWNQGLVYDMYVLNHWATQPGQAILYFSLTFDSVQTSLQMLVYLYLWQGNTCNSYSKFAIYSLGHVNKLHNKLLNRRNVVFVCLWRLANKILETSFENAQMNKSILNFDTLNVPVF